jgi:hypothetical protein
MIMPASRRKSPRIGPQQQSAGRDLESNLNPKTPLELARRLYERSPLTLARIGEIIGIHPNTIPRIARREGWKRRQPRVWRRGRLTRDFDLAASVAAKPGVSPAEVARAFASKSPEEIEKEREEIVGRLWENAKAEIARKEEGDTEWREAREQMRQWHARKQEMESVLLMSRTIESLLRIRKQLRGAETPEAARNRDEIGASILALLDELQSEGAKPQPKKPLET